MLIYCHGCTCVPRLCAKAISWCDNFVMCLWMRAFWCSGLRICSTEMVPFILSAVPPCTQNFIELCFQVRVGKQRRRNI